MQVISVSNPAGLLGLRSPGTSAPPIDLIQKHKPALSAKRKKYLASHLSRKNSSNTMEIYKYL